MDEAMNYYVTGANGFIGRNLIRYLTESGQNVTPVPRHFEESIFDIEFEEPFTFIHLSAYGNHYNQKDTSQIIKANIQDLKLLLAYFKNFKQPEKFINVSTSSITLTCQTMYSLSKHFGELMVDSMNNKRFINVRPYSVYGPLEAGHRFIPTVIRALKNRETIQLDPYSKHDWIYVDDFIEAMLQGIPNVGTGVSTSNLEVVKILEHLSFRELKYTPGKMRDYDTQNWVCPVGVKHIPIYEGLKRTYESVTKQNKSNQQEVKPVSPGVKSNRSRDNRQDLS